MDPIRVDQAQRLVNADSAFVEFVVTGDKLFLFVSSGTGSEREPARCGSNAPPKTSLSLREK